VNLKEVGGLQDFIEMKSPGNQPLGREKVFCTCLVLIICSSDPTVSNKSHLPCNHVQEAEAGRPYDIFK
jgi:hypothetical protein